MKKNRVIARLDVKGEYVVKGIQLEGLRRVGKPDELAQKYYLQGADELIYMDIVASLYERNNLLDVVKAAVSKKVFVPITVGGGVRKLQDIQQLLRAGADKVAINTAATRNPDFISEAAKTFGTQCIVGSIEAKQISPNKWEAYIDNGREKTGLDVVSWAKQLVSLGAGELFVTSVDKDGVKKGFDVALLREINSVVSVPVIASGGAGSLDDIWECSEQTGCDALAVASMLHYGKTSIQEIKTKLEKSSFLVRQDISFRTEAKNKELKNNGTTISVIDYGMGNIKSVVSGFRSLGCDVEVVHTPIQVEKASHLVLPGVGAFSDAMKNLKEQKLIDCIRKHTIEKKKPFLGICLGMQLLFSESEEFGLHQGLDIIPGQVVKWQEPSEKTPKSYRVPHVGWNRVEQSKDWKHTLLKQIPPQNDMYFVHSYFAKPKEQNVILGMTTYGQQTVAVAVQKYRTIGCQFHPEKSGVLGLTILKEFAQMEENNP